VSGVLGHDAAASLIRDGELVASAEEERFTRQKHAPGAFPVHATAYCLAAAGIPAAEVDAVAASWAPELDRTSHYLASWLPRFLKHPLWRDHRPEIIYVPHHEAHAASAAFFQGVDDAAVLVVDGNGENVSTTVGRMRARKLEVFEDYSVTESLGHFYGAAALYLGLGQHGEGKLMGLAGYGRPTTPVDGIVIRDGGYGITFENPGQGTTIERLQAQGRQWHQWFVSRFGAPVPVDWSWNSSTWHATPRALDLLNRADVAASVQSTLVDTVVQLASRATSLANNRRLILSGGVALNGGANAAILERGAADELVFFPGCHDAGASLGAAATAALLAGDEWSPVCGGPYLGPSASVDHVRTVLDRSGLPYSMPKNPAGDIARLIAAGRVVARFDGGMETGPRALGNRSILARADDRSVAERVNRIKLREAWRPFGPSIRMEDVGLFFDRTSASPYMLEFRRIREDARQYLAGVDHVDGTTRPQTVSAEVSPAYHALIGAVGEATGVPAVLNTSFNVGAEPIVCSPDDALRTFITSELDDLSIGPFLLSKPR
jgi:carbamoyltransferase